MLDRVFVHELSSDEVAIEEKTKHLRGLILAAGKSVDGDSSVHDLEAFWTEELRRRSRERVHLTSLEDCFSAEYRLPDEIEKRYAEFCLKAQQARFWLPSGVSETFQEFSSDALNQLKTWLDLNEGFDGKNKKAVIDVFSWFLSFVETKSELMHYLDSTDDQEEHLEEVLEACYLITENAIPSQCYEQIADDFLFSSDVVPIFNADKETEPTTPENDDNVTATIFNPTKNENNDTITTINKDQNNNTELDAIDYNNLPVPLQKYVQSESWEEAVLYCQQQKFNDLGQCLSFVKKSLSSDEVVEVSSDEALNISMNDIRINKKDHYFSTKGYKLGKFNSVTK